MQIPWQELSAQTLDTLLEEIVTRDGTDYGNSEKSTVEKVTHAKNQLKSDLAVLYWNTELESASLVSKERAQQLEAAEQTDKLP